ncbi:hypothetical protein EAG18_11520 [Pseudoalteromonas sp. J010]|uniref:Uncharacterized protein n=1 Tax=Pseudoalteromonas peptidolytica F12-50-A1 TaxID=1315280 RepID=A0A8I0N109_9GAMM|nr:hypothetical protein [Pseudoalteromonas peptidolytica F12-50-A1]RRS08351.1 hypothetical protein EAG18_11520 [Pseudoalteromonas sp. J010]GEK11203.1 hypothetical protein PPE03_34520 [Pseudoalteromonas peptidolytica]
MLKSVCDVNRVKYGVIHLITQPNDEKYSRKLLLGAGSDHPSLFTSVTMAALNELIIDHI